MAFFLFGFYSLLSQTLLLREISQVFGAHELALAGALAAWVFWTAAGVFLGAKAKLPGDDTPAPDAPAGEPWFAAAGLMLAAVVPANILAARLAPALLPPGMQPGLFFMLAGPVLLALPAGLANGLAAGFGLARLPKRFYAAEAAGAAAAGAAAIVYFRFFPQVSVMTAITLPALALAAACAFSRPVSKPRFAGFLLAAAALAGLNAAEGSAWRLPPPALTPGIVVQTQGARLAVTGPAGRETYYEDGRLLAAPEDTVREEMAHIALLALKKPSRILLSGSGAFFILPEVLKHRPAAVELAEPDVFKTAFLAKQTGAGGVKYLGRDLRALAPGTAPYDAIFQTTPAPDNAAMNRFFTLEFFQAAAARLAPGGTSSIINHQLPTYNGAFP